MEEFKTAMGHLQEKFGNKDNLIGISTIALEPSTDGQPQPDARFVDAYYEDGAFYTVTYATTKKIQQITVNPHVALCYVVDSFTATGRGENLGWVKAEKNLELAAKLREIFAEWYQDANNDEDPNTCILKVTLEQGLWNFPHEGRSTAIDFMAKTVVHKG